jgi:hypothetical protein
MWSTKSRTVAGGKRTRISRSAASYAVRRAGGSASTASATTRGFPAGIPNSARTAACAAARPSTVARSHFT